jgi:hypothetical protein
MLTTFSVRQVHGKLFGRNFLDIVWTVLVLVSSCGALSVGLTQTHSILTCKKVRQKVTFSRKKIQIVEKNFQRKVQKIKKCQKVVHDTSGMSTNITGMNTRHLRTLLASICALSVILEYPVLER